MSDITCNTLDNGCKNLYLPPNTGVDCPATGGGKISVAQSVGINGINTPPDVTTIQDALNRVSSSEGGANPPLKIDGLFGSKTKNAIQQFQIKQFGWSGADGKINPHGQTIARISQLLASPIKAIIAKDDTATQIFRNAMRFGIARAARMVRAALVEIDRAMVVVDMKDEIFPTRHSRADKMRRLNDYFKIDQFQRAEKFWWLQHIRRIFATIEVVLNRPGGHWGTRGFEIDDSGIMYSITKQKAIGWTNFGGFFRGGETETIGNRRFSVDSIYIIREQIYYLAANVNAAIFIVHELAHFCGTNSVGSRIDDFGAYGEPLAPKVFLLSPLQRVHHADSYSRFANACLNEKA